MMSVQDNELPVGEMAFEHYLDYAHRTSGYRTTAEAGHWDGEEKMWANEQTPCNDFLGDYLADFPCMARYRDVLEDRCTDEIVLVKEFAEDGHEQQDQEPPGPPRGRTIQYLDAQRLELSRCSREVERILHVSSGDWRNDHFMAQAVGRFERSMAILNADFSLVLKSMLRDWHGGYASISGFERWCEHRNGLRQGFLAWIDKRYGYVEADYRDGPGVESGLLFCCRYFGSSPGPDPMAHCRLIEAIAESLWLEH